MPVPQDTGAATWSSQQIRNAQIIISVGRAVGASARDIQIALATAMQESSLINVNYGGGSSLGLFQQINDWGSAQQRMDPYQAARMFFLGGHKGQPGLLDDHWREHQSLAEAAQWVQRSAFPDAYAKWGGAAAMMLREHGDHIKGAHFATTQAEHPLGGMPTTQPTEKPKEQQSQDVFSPVATPENPELGSPIPPEIYTDFDPSEWQLPSLSPQEFNDAFPGAGIMGGRGASVLGGGIRSQIVRQAQTWLGIPYLWGGSGRSGVDCSGLVQQVFKALGYELPRVSYAQANSGKRVSVSSLQPGDLVAWDNSSRNNGADHIAIYAGNGYIIEAPRTGLNVRKRKLGSDEGSMWGVSLSSLLG